MTEKNEGVIITNPIQDTRPFDLQLLNNSMTDMDKRISEIIKYLNLPTEGIVEGIPERSRIFKNLEDVINEITADKESMSYLSKFIYATADGLFDAALNYLWDAIVNELRNRIAKFDVEYFYDVIVSNQDKRSKLKGAEDLPKIQDSDLLLGARKIELIDSTGFQQLDHIRFMRNWASTAHPNEVKLSGLQLIDWLEQCIVKVFNVPYSKLNIIIQKLLSDIRKQKFSKNEIQVKVQQYANLSSNQINTLINGFFGIYVSTNSTSEARENIASLSKNLWNKASEDTKGNIGIKYGNLAVNGDKKKAEYARDFLEIVEGQSYIPDDLKIAEIANILSELKDANDQMNNFYTEPPLASRLSDFIGKYDKLPNSIENSYIHTIVYCYLTNGNGTAWNAEDKYNEMILRFTKAQAMKALMSYKNEEIFNKLCQSLSAKKFKILLDMLKPKIIQDKPKRLISFLEKFNAEPFTKFLDDSTYKKSFETFVNDNYLS